MTRRGGSSTTRANVAIVTAYNDMLVPISLSGLPGHHQGAWPARPQRPGRRRRARHVRQRDPGSAGDGHVPSSPRDLIAQATAVSPPHNTFDATCCSASATRLPQARIVGRFPAHLPPPSCLPAPWRAGISNDEKVKVRQQYAAVKWAATPCSKMECGAYHAAGTCTFYGTANQPAGVPKPWA